jgi:uncharacterized protein (DUF1015 family)
MAEVRPFRGLTYNAGKVSLEKVVTQPYDKISEEMRNRYYASDPHNIVRVILGQSRSDDSGARNVYTRAAATLREWRRDGVLETMASASFLAYFQRFTVTGTHEERLRKGFIGLGKLEDYANKVVYPHERTLAGPKQDRLQLLRHTRTHFEQIFVLYEDEEQSIDGMLDRASDRPPDLAVTDEYGVSHMLWVIDDVPAIEQIQTAMKPRKLIIADGHHRYETALAYRDEQRAERKSILEGPYDWLPMTFFNMHSPALAVLPTHRVVSRLQDFSSDSFLEGAARFFDIEDAPRDAGAFSASLKRSGRARSTIGVVTDAGARSVLLSLKPLDLSAVMNDLSDKERGLDVVILHRLLIEGCLGITEEAVTRESNITYCRGFGEAIQAVASGKSQIAFLLNPVRLDQLRDIVYEGRVMPQKSTDFYPKVLSGLVLYSLED